MTTIPRVVVAAPSSGHGKTAVAVGLIAALAARGLTASGFKVGPDFVDAGYLGLAGGRAGRNLDPRLVGAEALPGLLAHGARGTEVAVVEGTMGLYDGLSGRSDEESTAQVAGILRAPVLLVVDAAAMGQSVAALVHGFRSYDDLLWLAGVVLTRVSSDRHEEILRAALEGVGVPVLGALRRADVSPLPPRQNGLVPVVDRAVDAVRAVRRLGERMLDRVDVERVLVLARSAPDLPVEAWSPEAAVSAPSRVVGRPVPAGLPGPQVGDGSQGYATDLLDPAPAAGADLSLPGGAGSGRPAGGAPLPAGGAADGPLVAVAGAGTFSYCYPETIELLRAAGARIAPFDPLRDERLPEGSQGMVLAGGFPEVFADELAANVELQDDVVALARAGGPVYAENAGLLWLVKEFDGRPMCGVFDATAQSADLLVLGYRDAVARASSSVVKVGARVMGHKHHRTLVSPRSGDNAAWQWRGGRPEGFIWRKVHASYLTVHWAGYPGMARRFVDAVG